MMKFILIFFIPISLKALEIKDIENQIEFYPRINHYLLSKNSLERGNNYFNNDHYYESYMFLSNYFKYASYLKPDLEALNAKYKMILCLNYFSKNKLMLKQIFEYLNMFLAIHPESKDSDLSHIIHLLDSIHLKFENEAMNKFLSSIIDLDFKDYEPTYLDLAKISIKYGQLRLAKDYLNKISLKAYQFEKKYLEASILFKNQDYIKTLKECEYILKNADPSSQIWAHTIFLKASAEELLGQTQSALEHYDLISQKYPIYEKALLAKTRLYHDLKIHDKAQRTSLEYLKSFSHSKDAYILRNFNPLLLILNKNFEAAKLQIEINLKAYNNYKEIVNKNLNYNQNEIITEDTLLAYDQFYDAISARIKAPRIILKSIHKIGSVLGQEEALLKTNIKLNKILEYKTNNENKLNSINSLTSKSIFIENNLITMFAILTDRYKSYLHSIKEERIENKIKQIERVLSKETKDFKKYSLERNLYPNKLKENNIKIKLKYFEEQLLNLEVKVRNLSYQKRKFSLIYKDKYPDINQRIILLKENWLNLYSKKIHLENKFYLTLNMNEGEINVNLFLLDYMLKINDDILSASNKNSLTENLKHFRDSFNNLKSAILSFKRLRLDEFIKNRDRLTKIHDKIILLENEKNKIKRLTSQLFFKTQKHVENIVKQEIDQMILLHEKWKADIHLQKAIYLGNEIEIKNEDYLNKTKELEQIKKDENHGVLNL